MNMEETLSVALFGMGIIVAIAFLMIQLPQ